MISDVNVEGKTSMRRKRVVDVNQIHSSSTLLRSRSPRKFFSNRTRTKNSGFSDCQSIFALQLGTGSRLQTSRSTFTSPSRWEHDSPLSCVLQGNHVLTPLGWMISTNLELNYGY